MNTIKVEAAIDANIEKVWIHWNDINSIRGWAFASDTWECPCAENDLRDGGRFLTRMSAKDGSSTFDFTNQNRECEILFTELGNNTTKIEESFYPETENSEEVQRDGWAAILENFKKFVENN